MGDAVADSLFVIHHQDSFVGVILRIGRLSAVKRGNRTRNAVPPAQFALHFHRAPVRFHQALDQGQPQTGADLPAGSWDV